MLQTSNSNQSQIKREENKVTGPSNEIHVLNIISKEGPNKGYKGSCGGDHVGLGDPEDELQSPVKLYGSKPKKK